MSDGVLAFVAGFLGLLCFGLFTLIVLIAIKRAKGCRGAFCFRRRVEDEVPSSAISNKRTAGCSFPPQTSHSQEEETIPVYAAIDTKKRKDSMTKKKPLRLDLISAKEPTTYFGADGTEYQTTMRATAAIASDSGCTERSVTSPPPMQQPRLFETSTYASIDHDLPVPQFKAICK